MVEQREPRSEFLAEPGRRFGFPMWVNFAIDNVGRESFERREKMSQPGRLHKSIVVDP